MLNKLPAILELFCQGKRQYYIICLLNMPQQPVSDTGRHFPELGRDGNSPGSGKSELLTLPRIVSSSGSK